MPLPVSKASLAGDIRSVASSIDLTSFLAGLPGVATPTVKKTNPEDLVERMFPSWAIPCGARHVAACFWSWLCVLDGKPHCGTCQMLLVSDAWLSVHGYSKILSNSSVANSVTDLTENKDTRIALENIISILSGSPYDPLPASPLALSLMGAFHGAVQAATIHDANPARPVNPIREPWKEVFWSEVATVARALLAEQDLDEKRFTMQEWLDLRVVTISGSLPISLILFSSIVLRCRPSARRIVFTMPAFSPSPQDLFLTIHHILTHIHHPPARPLLVLLQASFNLPATSATLVAAPLRHLPLILGLQNDILGFDKDSVSGNALSAVQLLIRDGVEKKKALLRVVGLHNGLVAEMMSEAEGFGGDEAERKYVAAASAWPNAMARWMVGCERYR